MQKRLYEEIENSFYPSTDEGKRQWSDEALEWSNSHPNVGKKAYKNARKKMKKKIKKYLAAKEEVSQRIKEAYFHEEAIALRIAKKNT